MPSIADYYAFLVQLTAPLREPLTQLSYDTSVPFLTVFVLGLLGALSPCQLSTNLAAFAFISRDAAQTPRVVGSALAYTLGKILIYSAVGGIVILLGVQLNQIAIPVVVAARKVLGPILILLGLLMLGVIKLTMDLTGGVFDRLQTIKTQSGARASFWMGVGFSFAACPTLFVLFFGAMIPLAIAAFGGIAFPALFALGTVVPLMLFSVLVALGAQSAAPFVKHLRAVNAWASRLAAIVFILVGVNEIVLYWLI